MNRINKPIVILGAPRSGTTWLKELLTLHKDIWHLTKESHHIFEGPLHPKYHGFSNRPEEEFTLSPDEIFKIRIQLWREAINISMIKSGDVLLDKVRGNRYARKFVLETMGRISKLRKPSVIRLVEKTPKNSVRVKFVRQIFPDAKYIYIKREPVETIKSIYRGWKAKSSLLYKMIRGNSRFAASGYSIEALKDIGVSDALWRFVLPPGWDKQNFRDLLDIAIFQYRKSNELAERDLHNIEEENIFRINYEDLTANSEQQLLQLLSFSELSFHNYNFASLRKIPILNRTEDGKEENIDQTIREKWSLISYS